MQRRTQPKYNAFSTAVYGPVTPYECTPASSHTSDGPKRTAAGAAGRINQSQGRCEGRKFRFQLLLCVYSTSTTAPHSRNGRESLSLCGRSTRLKGLREKQFALAIRQSRALFLGEERREGSPPPPPPASDTPSPPEAAPPPPPPSQHYT